MGVLDGKAAIVTGSARGASGAPPRSCSPSRAHASGKPRWRHAVAEIAVNHEASRCLTYAR
jgi:hypothetical protein